MRYVPPLRARHRMPLRSRRRAYIIHLPLPAFQSLKHQLEQEWVPAMQQLLDIETDELPVLWDCDFLLGPKNDSGEDTYVLCEINVSSVSPFPDSALSPIAASDARENATQDEALRLHGGFTPRCRRRVPRPLNHRHDLASFDHTRGNAAVPSHRVVAAGAQILFHPRAGMALPGILEHGGADANEFVLQREQVDALDDDVPA